MCTHQLLVGDLVVAMGAATQTKAGFGEKEGCSEDELLLRIACESNMSALSAARFIRHASSTPTLCKCTTPPPLCEGAESASTSPKSTIVPERELDTPMRLRVARRRRRDVATAALEERHSSSGPFTCLEPLGSALLQMLRLRRAAITDETGCDGAETTATEPDGA